MTFGESNLIREGECDLIIGVTFGGSNLIREGECDLIIGGDIWWE